jgi:hypothetical protein
MHNIHTLEERMMRAGLRELINEGIDGSSLDTVNRVIARKISADQIYEEIQTHSGLGLWNPTSEQRGVTYDSSQPRFNKQYRMIQWSLGVKYSKMGAKLDRTNFLKSQSSGLADSLVETRNHAAAAVLIGGFAGGTVTSPDLQPVFSASHPLSPNSGGPTTVSNLYTTAMSTLALENMVIGTSTVAGDRGVFKHYSGKYNLIVGSAPVARAGRIVRSDRIAGSNSNDTNAYLSGRIADIVELPFLDYINGSSTDDYFLLPADTSKNPFVEIEWAPMDTYEDFDIDTLTHKYVAACAFIFDTIGYRHTAGANL